MPGWLADHGWGWMSIVGIAEHGQGWLSIGQAAAAHYLALLSMVGPPDQVWGWLSMAGTGRWRLDDHGCHAKGCSLLGLAKHGWAGWLGMRLPEHGYGWLTKAGAGWTLLDWINLVGAGWACDNLYITEHGWITRAGPGCTWLETKRHCRIVLCGCLTMAGAGSP